MKMRHQCVHCLSAVFVILLLACGSALSIAADVQLAWDASASPGVAGYKMYVGTASKTYGAPVVIGNQTTYTATGLAAGVYYFSVTAFDAGGNESDFSNEVSTTIGVPDATPPTISGVAAAGVTNTGATISWTTNEASDTQVEYGTSTSYGGSTALNAAMTTAHSQTLSGLNAGALYHYRVKSRDAAGNQAVSGDYTFSTTLVTPVDTAPPTISAVASSATTSAGATISWTTNEASDTQVEYGTSTSYGSSTALNATMTIAHSQTLSGLSASTLYHYRVKSRDAAGNLAVSGDFTFTTAVPPDATPPTINAVASSAITIAGATISWTTNEASDTQVEYGTSTSYGSSTALNAAMTTAHSQTLSGLSASTLYHYRVKSRDAAGNLAVSGDFTFTTAVPPDATAPTISAVASSAITSAGATISWTTNEASNTQVEYGTSMAYGSSTTLNGAMTTAHSQTLSGLSAGTLYHYRVKSRDAAGNLAVSGDFSFTTAAPPDATAPTISAVASSAMTSAGATISWTTNEASNTQVEYGTSTAYGSSTTLNGAMTTAHSQTLSGLSAGTLYHYRVKSRDAAGNLAVSADLTFTTAPDTTAPVISSVSVANVEPNAVTISWATDEPASGLIEYGKTASYGESKSLGNALSASHQVALSGLTAATLYHYRVSSTDAAGNRAVSGDYTFTTAADVSAPAISGVSVSSVGTRSAVISWTTDELADTQVDYDAVIIGVEKGGTGRKKTQMQQLAELILKQLRQRLAVSQSRLYESQTVLNNALSLSHAQLLSGLRPDTEYHFRVKSRDAAGNQAVSAELAFTTKPEGAAPAIANISVSNIANGSAQIDWITNKPSDSAVEYVENGGAGTSRAALTELSTQHSIVLNHLERGSRYSLRVSSSDADGNRAVSGEVSFTADEGGNSVLVVPRLSGQSDDVVVGMALVNPGDRNAAITVTAIDGAGNVLAGDNVANPKTQVLDAGAQSSALDRTLFGAGLPDTEGWLKLESSSPAVGGFFLTFDAEAGRTDGAMVGDTVLKDFAFSEIADSGVTRLAVVNSGQEDAVVEFNLMGADGSARDLKSRTIKANEAFIADLNGDLFDNPAPTDYVRISATHGVQPFEMLGNGASVSWVSGVDATGGASMLYAPRLQGDPRSTSITLINLDSRIGMATLRLVGEDGAQRGAARGSVIPAHGKLRIDVAELFPESGDAGYVEIVGEDGLRLAGAAAVGDVAGESTATLPLADSLHRSLLFGNVASSESYYTQLTILNPNALAAQVTMELHGPDGALIETRTDRIDARQSRTRLLSEHFPSLAETGRSSGYVTLVSDQPITAFSVMGDDSKSTLSAVPARAID